jgi:hypothetical protein
MLEELEDRAVPSSTLLQGALQPPSIDPGATHTSAAAVTATTTPTATHNTVASTPKAAAALKNAAPAQAAAAAVAPPVVVGVPVMASEFTSVNGIVVATFTQGTNSLPVSNYTATIDWGDGTTSPGTVVMTSTGYQVQGTHTYTNEGNKNITITVMDMAGGTSAAANALAMVGEDNGPTGIVGVGNTPLTNTIYEALEDAFFMQPTANQINTIASAMSTLTNVGVQVFLLNGVLPGSAFNLASMIVDTELGILASMNAGLGLTLPSAVSQINLFFVLQTALLQTAL